jgi:hypothetical protein
MIKKEKNTEPIRIMKKNNKTLNKNNKTLNI